MKQCLPNSGALYQRRAPQDKKHRRRLEPQNKQPYWNTAAKNKRRRKIFKTGSREMERDVHENGAELGNKR
jgi:hypothetical protein